ncbi:MAG TPA: FGGY-family carbohydrate kinase, partial [Casimicrobiaceae bacterium]
MRLFLGFDCGTQGLTAMVLGITPLGPAVVFEHSLDFDRDCPEFHTRHGVHAGDDALTVTAPPAMWAAALDRMLGLIAREVDVRRIAAISGSAQQHGTVYLRDGVRAGRFDSASLSRPESPVWMDESTRAQCDAIDTALGGADATARLTGSPATERFAGPQIRKFYEHAAPAYEATGRIHLVSSFLASILAGTDAPLEPGDAAGMNLMDIGRGEWSPAALAATAPRLRERLPSLGPSSTIAGPLDIYWRERYGFPAASVVVWTGDNPSSLVGTGLVREGDVGISLGTSDTVFAYREALPPPGAASHVFGSPTGGYMGLVCFRNGSLARERIRDRFGLDWAEFAAALRSTPAGNGGALLVPWFEPEITPRRPAGVRSSGLAEADGAAHVRAVVEAQVLAMAIHSQALSGRCRRIVATGGASVNREILQVIADVFETEVYQDAGGNAACLGAALRAWQAHESAAGRPRPWDEIVDGITDPPPATRIAPIAAHAAIYREMRTRYAEFETAEA